MHMERKLRLALAIKMLLGFIIAFLIAYLFKLPYSYTAGAIAVLHLWYSRENVFKTALIRLLASAIGLAVSALLFFLLGYNVYSLFLVILGVIVALYLAKIEFGTTIAVVLIGQQWGDQTAWAPLNAFFIMLIGTIPAILLNFFTFKKSKILPEQQRLLDSEIASIFNDIETLQNVNFTKLNRVLNDTKNSLQVALENYKIDNIMAALDYINMRAEQIKILERVIKTLNSLYDSPYKHKVLDYLLLFKGRIGVEDYASPLLIEHEKLLNVYRELPLPKTREEFEHRASLYGVLLEMKQLLLLKREYYEKHPTI